MNKQIDELLAKSNLSISNVQEYPELSVPMLSYGYTPERLQEGYSLYSAALQLHEQQTKEYGEKLAATGQLELKRAQANDLYLKHLKVARIAISNMGDLDKLRLRGKRKKSISGWLSDAKLFYTNLLGDAVLMEKVSVFGLTPEKLAAGQALVAAAEAAYAEQRKEMGDAQDATLLRDQAADKLQDWYSDFISIARLALEDKPQYLEMLGIVQS